MTDENKQDKSTTPQDPYLYWAKYFEEQQKVILNYWTQVMNNMWGPWK